MKYSGSVAFIFLVFISCQTTDKKTDKHSNELIEKFKPFLHGTWVPADYINDIVKTKSPLKSSEELTFIPELSIDTSGLSEDSIHAGVSFGNHEGGDFTLYFKNGQTPASLITNITDYDKESNFYEPGYTINSNDTSLILYHYDQIKNLLAQTKYIKVPKSNISVDAAEGLKYMVKKKLMPGTYNVTNSTGLEIEAELMNDGKITGLPGFTTYYVLTDFVADPDHISDELCFNIQTKNVRASNL